MVHTRSCCTLTAVAHPKYRRDEAEQLDINIEKLVDEGWPSEDGEDDGTSELHFFKSYPTR